MCIDSEVCVCRLLFQGTLTASAVGQIVGLQSEEIKQIASEYAEKVRWITRSAAHYF